MTFIYTRNSTNSLATSRFMHQLENAVVDLSPHLDYIAGTFPGSAVTLLDRGIAMLEELRARELEIDREELEQGSADDFDEEENV